MADPDSSIPNNCFVKASGDCRSKLSFRLGVEVTDEGGRHAGVIFSPAIPVTSSSFRRTSSYLACISANCNCKSVFLRSI